MLAGRVEYRRCLECGEANALPSSKLKACTSCYQLICKGCMEQHSLRHKRKSRF